jgi:NO-binding membrane sensor protein with MHYT domain
MAAMRMQAHLDYNLVIVAISLGIAGVASIAALWLVLNTTHLWQIVASALVMGLAVCGMHYTGMKAAIMRHDPALPAQVVGLSPEILAYVIFLVTLGDPVSGVTVGQRPAGDYDPAHDVASRKAAAKPS